MGIRLLFAMVMMVCISAPPRVSAETATREEMDRVCKNFLTYVIHQDGSWAGTADPKIAGSHDVISGAGLLARIYSIAPTGYVVVPGLKEIAPVRAYSSECDLDDGQTERLADLLRGLLGPKIELYAEIFGSPTEVMPAEGDGPFKHADRLRWDRFTLAPEVFEADSRSRGHRSRTMVGPLLMTAWHQNTPYNNECPDGNLDCQECDTGEPHYPSAVGCVATATAQLMNHHKWPQYGGGVHWYTWNGDQTCADNTTSPGRELLAVFSDAYDWANMPLDCDLGYTEDEAAAVAELCYEVGVAYDMDYGVCLSSANLLAAKTVLPTYFLYEDAICDTSRIGVPDELWWSIIRGEIDQGRPVLYALFVTDVGDHAIVIDGWADDVDEVAGLWLHLNFGWGEGENLAWFALEEYDDWPGGSPPYGEWLVYNIYPRDAEVYVVRDDGTGDFPTIQAAVDAAAQGDTIELADGIYTGAGNRDVNYGGKTITIRSQSGVPGACVIDCQGGGDGLPHRGFDFRTNEGPGAALEGVTITNGHSEPYWPIDGGAVRCAGFFTTPTFRNCVFIGNSASKGGAIYSEGRIKLEGCIISGNTAEANGGGICTQDAVDVVNCTFMGNAASAGGGLFTYGDPSILTNCTFYGNSATAGGGILCDNSSTILRNTIIAFSTAGEAIDCWGNSGPDLTCCDLFGNAGGDWNAACIAGQATLNGNIALDPLFCDAAGGDLRLDAASPCAPFSDPNPECELIGAWPVGGPDYADHDVGNCVLTVTDQGILGFMDGTQVEGSGFVYPVGGSNQLFIGGLWVAQDTSYVASRDYDADPEKEWTVSTEPAGYVSRNESGWISGDSESDQDLRASYTDSAAANPRGLFVEQESWAFAAPDPTVDLVILRYTLRNNGEEPLSGLYAGVFLDIDINIAVRNAGSTDAERNLVYMSDSTGIHVGLRLLKDDLGEPPLANLTLVGNPAYVWPNGYIHDADKYMFLSAADAAHVVGNAPNPDDWSVLASAGPFDLGVGEEAAACFAILGGMNLDELEANADAAALIYTHGITDAPPLDVAGGVTRLLPGRPNPFRRATSIQFELAQPAQVHLAVYDASGRLIRTLARGRYTGPRHALIWDSRDDSGKEVASGVYFMKLTVGARQEAWPLVRLR